MSKSPPVSKSAAGAMRVWESLQGSRRHPPEEADDAQRPRRRPTPFQPIPTPRPRSGVGAGDRNAGRATTLVREPSQRDRPWPVDRSQPEMAEQDRNHNQRRDPRGEAYGAHGRSFAAGPDVQTSGTGPWPFDETTMFLPRRLAS